MNIKCKWPLCSVLICTYTHTHFIYLRPEAIFVVHIDWDWLFDRSIHQCAFIIIIFTAGTMQKTTYYALPIIVHDAFHFLFAAFNSTWINHNCIVLWLKITQTFQVSILCVHVFVFFFLLNLPRKPQFVGREKLRCELGLSIFILILIIIIIRRKKNEIEI